MRSLTEQIKRYDVLLFLLAFALVGLYVRMAGGNFPLDDSWIHQVYGRNLAQTGQWTFVPGQPSAASTSPLYTVVLAVGYLLNVPYNLWPHLIGALGLFITGAVGARMAERLLPRQRWIGWLTGVALVIAWHLIWAAAAGMETLLFAMFTLVLIALAWREADASDDGWNRIVVRGAIFGAVAALTTLTRPEGLMLAGLVGLTVLIVRPQRGLAGALGWGVAAGIGFGIVIAPYLLLNVRLTGGLLPDTAAAKQAQAAVVMATVSFPQRLLDMIEPLAAGGQLLLLPGMVWFAMVRIGALKGDRRRLFDLLLLIWPVALIVLYAARLPAPYQHGRYVIPALPALIVAGMVGTFWLIERARRSMVARSVSRALLIAAMLVFVYFVLTGAATYVRDVRIIDEEMVTAAHWIEEHIPPADLLAIHDIGAVGYFAPRPILDIAGLVSPEIIPLIGDKEAVWQLMEARGARYLMAFPNQVPGGEVRDRRLCPVFTTHNPTALEAGGSNMTVYALAWDGDCSGVAADS